MSLQRTGLKIFQVFIVILSSFLVTACTLNAEISSLGASHQKSNFSKPEPTHLVLVSPAVSPSNDQTPTISVQGVSSGDNVKLFRDSNCVTEVASGIALGSTLSLDSSVLSEGEYTFYASVENNNETSKCSEANVTYVLDITPPVAPSALSLVAPSSSPGNNPTPTIQVNGVVSGHTVTIFTDPACSIQKAAVVASGSTTNITTSSLSLGSFVFYANARDLAGNVSECSTASLNYQLLSALGSFNITGISGATPDNIVDGVLGKGTEPVVEWGPSTGSSSYDVTIYANDGVTEICTTQNTASTNMAFTNALCGGGLTPGTTYKVKVVANAAGALDQEASNSLYQFQVNQQPVLGATGPWYVSSSGSITLNLSTTSPHLSASDPDGDTVTISSVGSPTFGSISGQTASQFTYNPGANTGVSTLSLTVDDTRNGRTTATITFHVVSPFTWTGGGSNSNFSTAANWCGAVNAGYTGCTNTGPAPTSSTTTTHVAIFDGTCGSNCSPHVTASASMYALRINSGYTGTFYQDNGFSMTIGSGGFNQSAGTFVGGNSNISIVDGPMALSGTANFTSTSASVVLRGNLTVTGSPTFTHNSGSFYLNAENSGATITPGSLTYNNFTFTCGGSCGNYTISGTLNLSGNLTLNRTSSSGWLLNNGTINVSGNITLSNHGYQGSTLIKLVGSGNQLVNSSGATNPWVPGIQIANTGGTVTINGSLYITNVFTYTSGTVDSTAMTTALFFGDGAVTITPGSVNFNNVTFSCYSGSCASYSISGTMQVNGNLTLDRQSTSAFTLNNGTVNLSGNLTLTNHGYPGSTLIKLVGTGNQTVNSSAASNPWLPKFQISNTGGTVFINGNLYLSDSFTYTSGTVDTSAMSFVLVYGLSSFTISSGPVVFNNVQFSCASAGCVSYTISGTMLVSGNLNLNRLTTNAYQINGGIIQVGGNLSTSNYGYQGTTEIQLVGTVSSTVNSVAGSYLPSGNVTINKTGGASVSLLSDVSWNNTGQTLNVVSGNIDMAGRNLTVKALSLNSNTVTKNSGTLIVNGGIVATGTLYGGTVDP